MRPAESYSTAAGTKQMTDPISVAAINASWHASYAKCFAPWSRMSPEEWAVEVYRLPNGGRFRWDFAPYTLAMYRSMFDRSVIETSYQIYSRGLKSTVILLAIGYSMDQKPRRILYMMPTTGQVEKFSKDNLCGELFDTTPCLNAYGSKGVSVQCEYLITGPALGTGVCLFSDGASYQLHFGGS